MLRALTRFPSSKFPQDLLTQEPVFDSYLRQLDAELLGRASLRKVTLEEVRDHLLEQQAALMDQGLAAEVAAQQALEGFGSPEELGRDQRRENTVSFLKNIVLFGLPYAVLMAVFALISDLDEKPQTLMVLGITFIFHFVFFGLFMSFFLTFSNWQARATKSKVDAEPDASEVLQIYSSRTNKILASIMLVFGISALLVSILGVMSIGIGRFYGVLGGVFMIYMSLLIIFGMLRVWTQTRLNGNQLEIKSVFGKNRYTIAAVKEFTKIRLWQAYWPLISGSSHKLTLVTDQGDEQTLYLGLNPADMYASDQLIARLESMKSRHDR